jgi:hypothetical protein
MGEVRTCISCSKALPISRFYSPPSGFRYICRECDIHHAKDYNRAHRDEKISYDRQYANKNPRRKWAHACLASHRRNGYVTELAAKQLFELASKTDSCYFCGRRLNWGLGNKWKMRRDSPSLDRLNNEKVIRLDNVVIACYSCNATKQDRTLNEFIEYCAAVATRFHSHFE